MSKGRCCRWVSIVSVARGALVPRACPRAGKVRRWVSGLFREGERECVGKKLGDGGLNCALDICV